jgi:hypothetical protein
MVRTRGEEFEMTLYLKYRAHIWVEVDPDAEDVLSVVVDHRTMSSPVAVVDTSDTTVAEERRTRAQAIADACDWPTWDYGTGPFGQLSRSGPR